MTSASQEISRIDAYLEGQQAPSQVTVAGMTALQFMLLVGQYSMPGRLAVVPPCPSGFSQESSQVTHVFSVSERDVMAALLQFHDRLLAAQEELPPDAAEVLYRNLWRLYG